MQLRAVGNVGVDVARSAQIHLAAIIFNWKGVETHFSFEDLKQQKCTSLQSFPYPP